ncbi:hypothetical protein BBK36DRAFT_1117129 [Trichoderma citrinoviride]|uniref:D-isomer specific 2-hydroxyacid dehydrogenase NAD-binding domain-containing protein n=1 Tax=Trichoderma citrinoviride TaxID=58853 RepID=A0A2T4BD57_9HYPO|nr:hypothetical protein BBK36DRAFT_1117129 [Trichoderma citrinoviride]PTB67181.1 hypothetical protein BBK36DRAFT_1117129 [Trichoderma citrinoviride]
MGEHLLLTLPFPKPEPLLKALHEAFPDMKITYVRHEVTPAEAFFKQDVDVPPGILREVTCLATFGFVPEPSDAPSLRYIHFAVAGTDHVSHKAAFRDPGVTITTSAGASSIAAAEWVVGSVLALTRRLFAFREMQGDKVWGNGVPEGTPFTLDGKRMGIVGYGSIGRQVARLAQALGMDIIVYNSRPRVTAEDRKDRNWFQPGSGDPDGSIPSAYLHGQSKEQLAAFLAQGIDVLVLALPLTPATKHLIGEEELAVLNASGGGPAILVNVARGAIVDQDALVASLKKEGGEGGLWGAALDVTDPEPLPAESELWGMRNVFVTPHVSSVARGTVVRALRILRENLGRRQRGGEMVNVVKTGGGRV